MTIGSLFTGCGGLCELCVAPLLDGEVVWHTDHDPAAAAVLAHHWPGTPNLGDVTAVDWSTVDKADVLVGGFPCQDISNAGRREGMSGARSGLWRYYVDAIRLLRPAYVFVENVSALVVRGLATVLADLAALGFDAEWAVVRASDVGACHERARIFLVAADPTHHRPIRTRPSRIRWARPADSGVAADTEWGRYRDAVTRWAGIVGRPAPAPTVVGHHGRPVLNPELSEWMMGLPAGHVTAVPALSRTDRLRVIGNGVVPHQGDTAYRQLLNRGGWS